MKKFSILLIIGLLLSLSFCGSGSKSGNSKDQSAGNIKTYEIFKDKITFYFYPAKKFGQVFVVGNFQGWNGNDSKWSMYLDQDKNRWELTVPIKKIKAFKLTEDEKQYEYKFVADGKWIEPEKKDGENLTKAKVGNYNFYINFK